MSMDAHLPEGDEARADRVRSLEKVASDLQRERDALQVQVTESETVIAAAQARAREAAARAAAAQKQADEALLQLQKLQASVDIALADKTVLEGRVAALQADVAGIRTQWDDSVAALDKALEEKAAAESRMAVFQEEADYALAQQARLQGQLMASRRDAEEALSLRDALAATRERLKSVEFEWEKSRKVLAIQTAEMDALRYETASQVAQASIQAGELEHRIGLLESALDSLRSTRPEGGEEDPATGKTWSMALENMQAQLLALREARSNNVPDQGVEEANLFESDYFEALPEDFEVEVGRAAPDSLPGSGDVLRNTVEDALGGLQEAKQEGEGDGCG